MTLTKRDPVDSVRSALTDLLNAIDDARSEGRVTDEGREWLTDFEGKIETLTHDFDKAFDPPRDDRRPGEDH